MTRTQWLLGLATVGIIAPLVGAQPPAAGTLPPTTGQPIYQQPAFGGPVPVYQPNYTQPSQGYSPYSRPGLSPYLNLFRGSGDLGSGAVNYYNFVRPQTVQNLPGTQYAPGGPAGNNTARFAGPDNDVILEADTVFKSTGHPSTFFNYGGYFNSQGTMGAGARPGAQQQQQTKRR